jgi:hypothetical protein
MSVHDTQPRFKDYQGYQVWRSDWRGLYAHAGSKVRKEKIQIKELERLLNDPEEDRDYIRSQISKLRAEHRYSRAIARKLMTALEVAKIHWQKIKSMRASIQEQNAQFPLELEGKNIDFHFNKASVEFDFIPMWVVKCRGKTFYVHHMDCQTGFSTRETPDHASTKGSLRVKRGTLSIDAQGSAVIS